MYRDSPPTAIQGDHLACASHGWCNSEVEGLALVGVGLVMMLDCSTSATGPTDAGRAFAEMDGEELRGTVVLEA
jgi:hypothetical protein